MLKQSRDLIRCLCHLSAGDKCIWSRITIVARNLFLSVTPGWKMKGRWVRKYGEKRRYIRSRSPAMCELTVKNEEKASLLLKPALVIEFRLM